MKNFSVIAKFPEVLGAALTDGSGSVLECSGQMDGEAVGAVNAFTARGLAQAGEALGLSTLERVSLVGNKSVFVIAVHDSSVLGVEIEPTKPLATVEKKIWDAITK